MKEKKSAGMSLAALAALAGGDLENFAVAATPGGIEAQEAAGQASLVASNSRLPKECKTPWPEIEKALGIKVLGDADDLFYSVKLPEGWKLQATGHSMWSKLLDTHGRVRAKIFYKAAFYDRSAHITFLSRYYHAHEPVGGYAQPEIRDKPYTAFVFDRVTNTKLWEGAEFSGDDYAQLDKQDAEARRWGLAHFPSMYNPLVYWN